MASVVPRQQRRKERRDHCYRNPILSTPGRDRRRRRHQKEVKGHTKEKGGEEKMWEKIYWRKKKKRGDKGFLPFTWTVGWVGQ